MSDNGLPSGVLKINGDRINPATEETLALVLTAIGSTVPTALGDGRKTVAVAGTREALAGSTACKRVLITAETDNSPTGVVVVGSSTVVASLSTRRGFALYAGDWCEIETDNLADVYLDSTVSGDGVTFVYNS